MGPRWKWKGAKAKALAEPMSKSVSELQLSLAETESSGSLTERYVLLSVEPEQAELLHRCCFGSLVLSADKVNKLIQLTFEEAFYLLYSLKCIKLSFQGHCLENEVDAWLYMKSRRPKFPIYFKAYSHLRSKNWVLRQGYQYGVDFVAYRHHPSLVHSEFAVLVQSFDGSDRLSLWSDICSTVRLSGSVAKTLLTLDIVNGNSNKEDLNLPLPLCLEKYSVEKQTIISRWNPELSCEDETTNPNPKPKVATQDFGIRKTKHITVHEAVQQSTIASEPNTKFIQVIPLEEPKKAAVFPNIFSPPAATELLNQNNGASSGIKLEKTSSSAFGVSEASGKAN